MPNVLYAPSPRATPALDEPLFRVLQRPDGGAADRPPAARVNRSWLSRWLLLVLVTWNAAAWAASVGLAWDPSPSGAVRGYYVYYVVAGTGSLTQPVRAPAVRVDAGLRTSYTLPNLADGTTYQIAVTAYDGAGGESGFSNMISAAAPGGLPVAAFSSSTRSGVAPLAMNFINESTGAPTSYAWTFGDGTTSTSASPAKVYSTPGTYTVSLTARNATGSDIETKTAYVTVTTPTSAVPVAGFSAGTRSGVAPLTVNFANASSGTGITSYAWTFGDGTTSTSASPVKVYSTPGTYTVSLTVRNASGSGTETKTGYIAVSAPASTAPRVALEGSELVGRNMPAGATTAVLMVNGSFGVPGSPATVVNGVWRWKLAYYLSPGQVVGYKVWVRNSASLTLWETTGSFVVP